MVISCRRYEGEEMKKHYADRQVLKVFMAYIALADDDVPEGCNPLDYVSDPDVFDAYVDKAVVNLKQHRIEPEGSDDPTQEQIDRVLAFVESQGWKCVPKTATAEILECVEFEQQWDNAMDAAPKFEAKK